VERHWENCTQGPREDEGVGGGEGEEEQDEVVEEVDDFREEDLRMGLGAL